MKTTSDNDPIDLLGLEVYTQMSAEESQEGGDIQAAKIYGDLNSLVCREKERRGLRLDALEGWITPEEVAKTKEVLDSSATGEILLILTALRVMAYTTSDHADDLRADEAFLRAEDAEGRSARYRTAYQQLLDIFNS